jgi:hypothetical protein
MCARGEEGGAEASSRWEWKVRDREIEDAPSDSPSPPPSPPTPREPALHPSHTNNESTGTSMAPVRCARLGVLPAHTHEASVQQRMPRRRGWGSASSTVGRAHSTDRAATGCRKSGARRPRDPRVLQEGQRGRVGVKGAVPDEVEVR